MRHSSSRWYLYATMPYVVQHRLRAGDIRLSARETDPCTPAPAARGTPAPARSRHACPARPATAAPPIDARVVDPPPPRRDCHPTARLPVADGLHEWPLTLRKQIAGPGRVGLVKGWGKNEICRGLRGLASPLNKSCSPLVDFEIEQGLTLNREPLHRNLK